MNRLGIRSKLLLGIGTLAFGYVVFFGLVQWTTLTTQRHLARVSGAIYPATLNVVHAQMMVEKMQKDYKDAVLLQDKTAFNAANEDGRLASNDLDKMIANLADQPVLKARVSTSQDALNRHS